MSEGMIFLHVDESGGIAKNNYFFTCSKIVVTYHLAHVWWTAPTNGCSSRTTVGFAY